MIYEFECPKGHVVEAMVPMGTKQWPCSVCEAEMEAHDRRFPRGRTATWSAPLATRILSATRTTFVFADTGKRIKHIKKVAARD